MTRDPEERKAQRQQREAQRKAKRRKWLLIGGIALAVAIAAVITVAVLIGSAEPVPANTTTIHLAAAGDLNITDRVVLSGGSNYDYTKPFLDVASLLADADISIMNLEGCLVGPPYTGGTASAPQELLAALDRAGVDLLQLANSYSIYHGISGLQSTISAVKASGLTPLGAYANESAFRSGKGYVIREVEGIRIGFAAFTKGMDGTALPSGSEHCVNLLYTDYNSNYQEVNTAGITAVLDAMNKEKPDLTVVMLHWGSEFNDTVSSSQEEIVELLQAKGVNAIIGTHPHYVQKMVLDRENNTFIAYSLGDFFGDASRAGSEYSVILDLEITKDHNSGKTYISDFSYTPIFTVSDEPQLRVLRINEAMAAYENNYYGKISKETYDKMAYALTRIDARIKGE